MYDFSLEVLESGLKGLGITPRAESLSAILQHLALLSEWNERINLTAIKDPQEMIVKHVVDSAAVMTVIDPAPGMRLLDVGSGAGFPGVTLKCLVPEWDTALLESTGKKCEFLEAVGQHVVQKLPGTGGYEVVCGRAEELGRNKKYREQFDIVVARAVAELRVLSELCLPFCRRGGIFIALKGPKVGEEIACAEKAIRLLGGVIAKVAEVSLPCEAGDRRLVIIRKERETPSEYPRRVGVPGRNPL